MNAIKRMRRECGMTQDQLAGALDVSQSAVAMWERGQCVPRPDKLIKLSELFGCTVDELLKGESK